MAGIFGNIMPGETAGMSNPLWQQLGIPQFTQVPSSAPQQGGIFGGQPAQEKQKPNWLGILSDGLLAFSGKDPIYMQSMQAQRNAALKAQQEAAHAAAQDAQWYQHKDYELSHSAPVQFENKAGDRFQLGPDGKPQLIYKDDTPNIVPVQGSGVYAMDRHSGKPFQSVPEGFTPLSPDEIKNLGLHPDGPTGGGVPSGSPIGGGQGMAASQTIPQAEFLRLRQIMGDGGVMDYLRTHNIAVGN